MSKSEGRGRRREIPFVSLFSGRKCAAKTLVRNQERGGGRRARPRSARLLRVGSRGGKKTTKEERKRKPKELCVLFTLVLDTIISMS